MIMKLNKKDVKFILEKSFPNYIGRKFRLEIIPTEKEIDITSYWSGGSKDSYAVVNFEGDFIGSSKQYHNAHPALQEAKSPKWKANKYQVLVQHTYFCGKDCGITIYATEDSEMIPKNLIVDMRK